MDRVENYFKMSPKQFKRIVGTTKPVFRSMLAVLQVAFDKLHEPGGKAPDLTPGDKLLITLEYYREYRTKRLIGSTPNLKKPPSKRAARRSSCREAQQDYQDQVENEPPNRLIDGTYRRVDSQFGNISPCDAAAKDHASNQQGKSDELCNNSRLAAVHVQDDQCDNADQDDGENIPTLPRSDTILAVVLNHNRRSGGNGNGTINERLRFIFLLPFYRRVLSQVINCEFCEMRRYGILG